ncbi:MAG: DNA gyrase C-terminal beta-propeller domain-containing protein, partial [Chthoniobacterales bacterium]
EKVLGDISAIRDESDENTRVVIELKRDGNPKVVINNLYKHTALESSFAASMLAIDHGRPKLLNLKDANVAYIEHRREVVLRRTRFELRKAEERAETLEGYLIALANLDEFIRIIRGSANREEARVKLLAFEFTRKQVEKIGILIRNEARLVDGRYAFSEHQANQILDLRLYQLTGLEREKIEGEYNDLTKTIKDLRDILAKESRVFEIIKKELREIQQKYATPRLTQLVPDEGEINMEDLIANEGTIISITHGGFIKRTAVSAFRAQRRGGKGVIGMQTREGATEEEEGDFAEHLFTATTHDYLMFFTESGRAYVEKVYEIPEMGRAAKGRSIANLLELRSEEKIAATIRVQSKTSGTGPNVTDNTWDENFHIAFATRTGIVKKSNLSDYKNVRKGGIIAIQIEEGDKLIDAKLTTGNNEIVLITKEGMSLRFHEEQLRDQGRNTVGVWGIRPEKSDHVVASAIVNPDAMLLVAGENGIGKRTSFEEYRRQSRGGKGIITMKTGEKTGNVVGALSVTDKDELMLITTKGQMVRTRVKEIRETGRNAQGVKLMDLKAGEKLQAIAPVVSQAAEESEVEAAPAE